MLLAWVCVLVHVAAVDVVLGHIIAVGLNVGFTTCCCSGCCLSAMDIIGLCAGCSPCHCTAVDVVGLGLEINVSKRIRPGVIAVHVTAVNVVSLCVEFNTCHCRGCCQSWSKFQYMSLWVYVWSLMHVIAEDVVGLSFKKCILS